MSSSYLSTGAGRVEFVTMAGAGLIDILSMDGGVDNFRPPEKQKKALAHITGLPGGMVSLALCGQTIIGYINFYLVNRDYSFLYELGGVEVAPSWRRLGVAAGLFRSTFADPIFDNYIVYVTGCHYDWDLAGTGLDVWQYRGILARLCQSVGFVEKVIIKPDIFAHSSDLFMVRTGRNAPAGSEDACCRLLGVE